MKELKKEILAVKKGFQVSKLKRADVERVILLNHQHFQHLLKKAKVKKAKPTYQPNKQQLSTLKKKLNDVNNNKEMRGIISKTLDELDERAKGRKSEFGHIGRSNFVIQKAGKRYILRHDSGDVLLSTENRKEVEDFLNHLAA